MANLLLELQVLALWFELWPTVNRRLPSKFTRAAQG